MNCLGKMAVVVMCLGCFAIEADAHQYVFTSEEKGHYILGYTGRPCPSPKFEQKSEKEIFKDTTRVLISLPNTEGHTSIIPDTPPLEERIARMNDSQDLEEVIAAHTEDHARLQQLIKAHKWRFQFKEFNKLVR